MAKKKVVSLREQRKALPRKIEEYTGADKKNKDASGTLSSQRDRAHGTTYGGSRTSVIYGSEPDKTDNATTKERGPNKNRTAPKKPKAPSKNKAPKSSSKKSTNKKSSSKTQFLLK